MGIIVSYSFNNVVDLLIQSYELSVSCLFVPVFAALFKKNGNIGSALGAIVLGAISFCLFRAIELPVPREVVSLALSTIGFFLGEAWARFQAPQQAHLAPEQ